MGNLTHLSIALDGPAGSGKSSVAKQLANELNIHYLDTGAMYRAVAFAALEKGIDPKDAATVESLLKATSITVHFEQGNQRVYIDDIDVTANIRTSAVSNAASDIAMHPSVRYKLAEMQRAVASQYDIVVDGRDIGTFVLPEAEYKFFLTASEEVRAKRRFKENKENGIPSELEDLRMEIKQRDYNDTHRELAPLKQAEDAIKIDSSDLTLEEVVGAIMSYVKGGQQS
jgi:cytidylate kinase